jgi:hypothetical protein
VGVGASITYPNYTILGTQKILFRLVFLLFFLSACDKTEPFDYKKSKYYEICKKESVSSPNPFQTQPELIQECVSMYREGQQE